MGKTLSIETGIRCNNRCAFCYQVGWRCDPAALPDPSFDTLSAKLKWGIVNGYDSVGFSGGEPTVRKDLPDLVSAARGLGYRDVAVTTNGRRFSDRGYARSLLSAGLTGIGWSLHGPSADVHDELVGRSGAFDQVVAGLGNVQALSLEAGNVINQNMFCLLTRRNHATVAEVGDLGRRFGIRLLVLQPVIFSKANLSIASRFSLPLDEVVSSVRRAALAGKRGGWFVKLFNLPPCFFTGMLDAFEHQRYPVDVFRYQDKARAGENIAVPGQGYLRLDRCADCLLPAVCPGLHQSLAPQSTLLRIALDTLRAPEGFAPGNPPGPDECGGRTGPWEGCPERCRGAAAALPADEAWVAGTEMFDADTLADFLAGVRARTGVRRLRVYYGGDGISGDGFAAAAVRGGASEIVLAARGLQQEGADLASRGSGNLGRAGALSESPLLGEESFCGRGLAVPFMWQRSRKLADALLDIGRKAAWTLEIGFPPDFTKPEAPNAALLVRQAWEWRLRTGERTRVVLPQRAEESPLPFRSIVRAGCSIEHSSRHWCSHYLSGPMAGWICISLPSFVTPPGAPDQVEAAAASGHPTLSGLPGEPIRKQHLDKMRPG